MMVEVLTISVCIAALFFLLTNGMNDASSVVASFIACGAAAPFKAVVLAAVFGVFGAVTAGRAVSDTIAGLVIVQPDLQLLIILLSALFAAVSWNYLTCWLEIPSSSTHSLIGGLIGAVWAAQGIHYIAWGFTELWNMGQLTGMVKVAAGLLISPLLGFGLAFSLQKLLTFTLKNACSRVNKWLKLSQWLMAAVLAYNHGANDTQKVLGVILLALTVNQSNLLDIPVSLKLLAGGIMFAGTMFGGWSIMKTLGRGIYTLRPIHGFNSQLATGSSLLAANLLGAPVSTTHVSAGSIIGVGAADEYKMVNWDIGKDIAATWCITIPATAVLAAIILKLLSIVLG